MALSIEKIDVWTGTIPDRPGGVAQLLKPLADAGADLEFLLARRSAPGKGLVFLAPLQGAAQLRAAKQAGLSKGGGVAALRVSGSNKQGLGAQIAQALGDAGVNMRGISGSALGRSCAVYVSFDSVADAAKAKRVLAKALGTR